MKLLFLILVSTYAHAQMCNPYRERCPTFVGNYQKPSEPITIEQGNPTGFNQSGFTTTQGQNSMRCKRDYRGKVVCQ